MMLTKTLTVRINNKNIEHYTKIGYDIEKVKNFFIEIPPNHLPIGSKIKIKVSCDNCLNIIDKPYREYLKHTKEFTENYYCVKCNSIKRKKTMLEKYGVEHALQNEISISKFRNTCLERYGFDSYAKTEESIERSRNNKFFNSLDFIKISRATKFLRYGDINYNNSDKRRDTCMSRYDVDSYAKTEECKFKCKQTCLERYGVDNISKLESIKLKKIKTCLINNGTEYPLQNIDIFIKSRITAYTMFKYNDTNLNYQASYELDFLDKYYELLNIENAPSVNYELNDVKRIYHPDFYLPKHNLIIEIKSSYTYECELIKNLTKESKCLKDGYNFIFIINKNYEDFEKYINL